MKVSIMLILPLISCAIGTADHIRSQVNLDLSKFYYFTKVIENKSHITITKLFKSPKYTSPEITIQNIIAFARCNNFQRIEIPRSLIDFPLNYLNFDSLNRTKIAIQDTRWNYYLVAYPVHMPAVTEFNIDDENEYFEAINSHTDLGMYRIFAINDDRVIIGGCQLRHDYHNKDRSVIELLYVSTSNRNKGIGTHLVEAAKELSQAYSKNYIKLFAFPYGNHARKNEDLINWYKCKGFSMEHGKQFNMIASVLTQASSQQNIILEFD